MAGPITIAILANGRQARSELDRTSSAAQKIGGGFRKAALPAAALAGGLALIGKEALAGVQRVERINAQTAAVVKSTGGAAGVTAGHVEKLAGKLENYTATEAEATQEGANLLLTFTNIQNKAGKGNAIFDRTTTAMVDLARAMGTEPKAAAIQLGKALNDPIKGVGALSRVGVSFTEQQKAQIKTLTETGNVMGAQKIILKELETQFGGSGRAFAQTTEGQIELAKHAFGTLTEEIAVKLIPTLLKLAQFGTKALNWATENSGKVTAFVAVLAGLAVTVLTVNAAMSAAGAVMAVYRGIVLAVRGAIIVWRNAQLALNIAMMLNPIGVVVVAIVALVAVFVVAWKRSETFRRVVTGAWEKIKAASAAVFGAVKRIVVTTWNAVRGAIGTATRAVLGAVTAGFRAVRTVVTTVARGVLASIRAAWSAVRAATSGAWNAVKSAIGATIRAAYSAVRNTLGAIRSVVSTVWQGIRTGTRNAWDGIKTGVRTAIVAVLDIVRTIRSRVTGVFANAGGWLLGAGRRVLQGLLDGIGAMIGRVREKLQSVTNMIPDWKGPRERDANLLRPAGRLILGSLIKGFDQETPKVRRFLGQLSDEISTFDANPKVGFEVSASDVYAEVQHNRRLTVDLRLRADQVSQLTRGRELRADLAAYESVSGAR